MALADSITALGTAIINLVGTRLNRDANNFSTAGTQNLNNMIDSRIGAVTGAPVGTVIAYMGTDEPEGFLLMDGRELSRTTYAALFAVIGTSQGAGNGSTTFNIADMTDGRYLMGSTVAGTSIPAQIPNLVSSTYTWEALKFNTSPDNLIDGCFSSYGNDGLGARWDRSETSTGIIRYYQINASLISNIYRSTNYLRPESKTVKFFIRY